MYLREAAGRVGQTGADGLQRLSWPPEIKVCQHQKSKRPPNCRNRGLKEVELFPKNELFVRFPIGPRLARLSRFDASARRVNVAFSLPNHGIVKPFARFASTAKYPVLRKLFAAWFPMPGVVV